MLDERLEILLEQIRNAIAENEIPYAAVMGIEQQLKELNETMRSIKAYLAQLASKE
jgi:hypothetical protein